MSGRASTPDEKRRLVELTAKYLLGDPENNIEPKGIVQIEKILGKSNKSVKLYKAQAIRIGLLQVDDKGHAILPEKSPLEKFKHLQDHDELLKNESIVKWFEKQQAKNGSKGTKIMWVMLNNLLSLFNTLKITPQMLIEGKSNERVEAYRNEYMKQFVLGKAWQKSNHKVKGDSKTKEYNMNQAINSFCNVNGIVWERGSTGMHRVVQGHGKYSDVRLIKNELAQADGYLLHKFGLDSDEYRWFWIGLETCSRYEAIRIMKSEYEEVLNEDGSTKSLHLKTFESKLEHTKTGGDVKKFVRRLNTIKSIKLLRKRNCHKIIENKKGLSESSFRIYITQVMKDLFTHLGKDPESYFFIRPTHVLRHLGAHYWLAKSSYRDFTIVSKIGNWTNVQEMIDSYGDTPPEVFQKTLDGYDYSE